MNQAIECLEDIDQMSVVLDKLIDDINKLKFQYLTGNLPEEQEKTIRKILTGNLLQASVEVNKTSAQVIVSNLLLDYVGSIAEFPSIKNARLAFHASNREIHAWVIIPDDRDDIESDCYRLEAKINREYRTKGFSLTTTVVESSDHINLPTHFKELTMNG